jgi:hypothetical protein
MSLFLDLDDPRSPLPPTGPDPDNTFWTFDGFQGHLRKRSIPDVPLDIEFSFEDIDASMSNAISPHPCVQDLPQFGDPFTIGGGRRNSWIDSPATSSSSISPMTGDRKLEREFPYEDWSPPSSFNAPRSPRALPRVQISHLDALALNVKSLSGPMFSELEIETKPVWDFRARLIPSLLTPLVLGHL